MDLREDIIIIFTPPYNEVPNFLESVDRYLTGHSCGYAHTCQATSAGRRIINVFIKSEYSEAALRTFYTLAAEEQLSKWAWDYHQDIVWMPLQRPVAKDKRHLYHQ